MVSAPKYLAQAAQVHQKQQLEQDESARVKADFHPNRGS